MTNSRKKAIIVAFLCAMIGFVACSDKEDTATKGIKTSSANVCIAAYNARSGETTLRFNADRFRSEFERQMMDSLRMEVVTERVKIEDAYPTVRNYTGALLVSYFDVNSEATSTYVVPLDKNIDADGNVTYYTNSEKTRTMTVSCKSENCTNGECMPVWRDGVPVDCSACSSNCEKTIVATSTSPDRPIVIKIATILERIAKIISALL